MMVSLTGSDWDSVGQWAMAIGMVAMLAYLAPAMMALTPQWRRRWQVAAPALLGVALLIAVGASLAWFTG